MIASFIRHLLVPCVALTATFASAAHPDHGQPSGVCSLDVAVSGRTIHLLVGEHAPHSKNAGLHAIRSDDGGATWSAPVRVDEGNRPPSA